MEADKERFRSSRIFGGQKMKAQSQFSIFTFIIVGLLVVLFSAGLIYVSGILNNVFHEVGVINDQSPHQNISFPCVDDNSKMCSGNFYVNMTKAADNIWGTHYQSIQALRMVSLVYLLCLMAGIVVTAALERKHPMLFFVYFLFVILGIIFSPAVSNAYDNLLSSNVFGGELNNFTASNFILLNLPVFVLVVGVLSLIFLFINLVRAGGDEMLR